MASINLLPQEEKAQERFISFQRRLQISSVLFLVAVAVITIVTLIFYTSLSAKRAEIINEIQEASSKIEAQKAKEELIAVVVDKTLLSEKILDARVDYVNFFNKLAAIIPQGVYFTDIKVLGGKAVFSGRAKTSADVAGLASSFSSAGGAEILSSLTVDNLSADETGIYSFVISAKLAQ